MTSSKEGLQCGPLTAGPSIFDYIIVAFVSHIVDYYIVVPPIRVEPPAFVCLTHFVVVSVPKRGLSSETFEIVSFKRLVNEESFEVSTILKPLRLPEVDRAVMLPAREDLILDLSD